MSESQIKVRQMSFKLKYNLYFDCKVETEAKTQRERTESERSEGNESNPDLHFEPIIELPLIDIKTLEENETEILKL